MKLVISISFFILSWAAVLKAEIIYLNPVPNAEYVSVSSNLIFGVDSPLDESIIDELLIVVTGSKSGMHKGKLNLSSDKKKIIFTPYQKFQFNELVTVQIYSINSKIKYNSSGNFGYSFKTEKANLPWNNDKMLRSELGEFYRAPFKLDSPDPPNLTVNISNNPSPGKILLGAFAGDPSHLLIAENDGSIFYYQQVNTNCYDFKKHPDGTYTYFSKSADMFIQLDRNYQIIDSFDCGNGYTTDLHELIFAPNGNVLLMSYDPQIVDMSQIVPGGDTAATVIGLVIQEIDPSKDLVVFQWRSWDHFHILDATQLDFTSSNIDYVHGNAIEVDNDGNLLISCRHMDEITKIDRSTGAIIWRLGGNNNQFQFINDTIRFTYQHDIRRLNNGNITLYDNGNFHNPRFSRAVEYQLDEVNKKATLVWEYRNNPTIYGFAMGSARRLPNGNTIIGWGYTRPTLTEVTPQGQIALEMSLPVGVLTYRVFKYEWDTITSIPVNQGNVPESYSLSQNYPNPFNPSTSISFAVPVSGNVTLKVYDIMGREISTLVNEIKEAGSYDVIFNATGLASGVYIYKMEAENYYDSKKMALIK